MEEETEIKTVTVKDPIAPWNRLMFKFNDKLYYWVLKPVSKGYAAVLPQIMRTGIKNFFYNIKAPIRIAGCLLQGKGGKGGKRIFQIHHQQHSGCFGIRESGKKIPAFEPKPGRYRTSNRPHRHWKRNIHRMAVF